MGFIDNYDGEAPQYNTLNKVLLSPRTLPDNTKVGYPVVSIHTLQLAAMQNDKTAMEFLKNNGYEAQTTLTAHAQIVYNRMKKIEKLIAEM